MKIRSEIKELLDEHGIPFVEEVEYLSCKLDKYRIYIIEEDEIINYSWERVPKNYFFDISFKNEQEGIHTLWIKSFEWKSTKKREVMISGLLCDLGIIKNRYYGRNCIVEEIGSREAQTFLEEHSFYGKRGASLTLGLRHKKTGELLMLMSFGSSHYARKKWDCEVIRAATKKNSQVIGGASKLFKFFLEKHPSIKIGEEMVEINTILFYVDYDHKQGNSMPSLGYELTGYTKFGFHNFCLKDSQFGEKGSMFMRKPHKHKQVMECVKNGEVVSICNAGNKIYIFDKSKGNEIDSNSTFISE
jgi:hypothetical protein